MYEMGISLLLSLVMMCSSGGNVAQAEITPWEPSALYTDEEILDAIGPVNPTALVNFFWNAAHSRNKINHIVTKTTPYCHNNNGKHNN